MTTSKKFMKASEVAKTFGVSRAYIYKLIDEGKIPTVRPFGTGTLFIPISWFNKIIEELPVEVLKNII